MVYTDSWPHEDAKAFASLMSPCQTADADAKFVTLIDEMMLIAVRCGAVRTLRLGVDDVGVSPFNRNKKLLSGRDVHTLASNLAKVGFSWQRCGPQRAIAMQENPRTKEIAAATTKLCEDPLIAPMGKAMPLAGSLGCGHLNQSLRLHKHKHHTPIVDLQEHGGARLDTDRLCADDPQLRKARDEGLVWQMIEYRLQEQYPDLSGFISSALNVENAVARAESWDEQLARTVNAAIASAKDCKGQGPDWEHVQRQVAWSMPPNIADIGSHVDYIRKYGGGVNTNFVFIQELTSYIRSSMPSGRKVAVIFQEDHRCQSSSKRIVSKGYERLCDGERHLQLEALQGPSRLPRVHLRCASALHQAQGPNLADRGDHAQGASGCSQDRGAVRQ